MSQPPHDPQGYPWGPPEPSGASPQGSRPPEQPPQPAQPQPAQPQHDPYGGGQYSGPWTQHGDQQGPYTGIPHGSAGPVQQPGYGAPVRHGGVPTSTIILLVVSGISVVTGFLFIPGIAPLVLAIVAMVRAGRDPAGARHLTRIGWIVYGVVAVLTVIGLVALFAWIARMQGSGYDGGGYSALGALAGVSAGVSA